MGQRIDVLVFVAGGADGVRQLSNPDGGPIGAAGTVISTSAAGAQVVATIVGAAPVIGSIINAVGLAGTALSAVQLTLDIANGQVIKAGDTIAVGVGIPVGIAIAVGSVGAGSILIPVAALAAFSAAALNLGGFTLDDVFNLFPRGGTDSPISAADRRAVEVAIALSLPLSGSLNPLRLPAIDQSCNRNFQDAQNWIAPRDPLVLDLDNDGIETVGINPAAPILFDMDGDGVKTATGWIKADDGMVVLDRNGNGLIDSGRELFGDSTILTRGPRAGQTAANGYEALADLDINGDGVINSLDAAYASLRIWQDANQDGVSEASELFSLSASGVAHIKLKANQAKTNLDYDSLKGFTDSFVRSDGQSSNVRFI